MSLNAFSKTNVLARRAVLLSPLALAGCSWFDDWFGEKKKLLPGKRENVFAGPARLGC